MVEIDTSNYICRQQTSVTCDPITQEPEKTRGGASSIYRNGVTRFPSVFSTVARVGSFFLPAPKSSFRNYAIWENTFQIIQNGLHCCNIGLPGAIFDGF